MEPIDAVLNGNILSVSLSCISPLFVARPLPLQHCGRIREKKNQTKAISLTSLRRGVKKITQGKLSTGDFQLSLGVYGCSEHISKFKL